MAKDAISAEMVITMARDFKTPAFYKVNKY